MGRRARIRRNRALMRHAYNGPPMKREPFQILRAIHQTIQNHCHENGRRCWEYLVEMLAQASGWPTETNESEALWDKMQGETRWLEFLEAWIDEVSYARKNRIAFSEPIGELLEHVEGTNLHFEQYFTPMQVVRAMNEITFSDLEQPESGYLQGIDPCCGTGRFMLDALIFNDRLIMGNVDLDLWLQRVAKLNARLLSRWTTLREPFLCWDAMLAGRARFIWGDALVVDLQFPLNWLLSWCWTPNHWQSDLKISGFDGTYEQWLEAGGPAPKKPHYDDEIRFDYSMDDPVSTPLEKQHERKPARTTLAGSPFASSAKRSRASGNTP